MIATLGSGAILAPGIWNRRSLSRRGTNAVFVMVLVGCPTAIHQFLARRPRFSQLRGLSYTLEDVLTAGVPGAILGAWIVAWLGSRHRHPDWRERLARMAG